MNCENCGKRKAQILKCDRNENCYYTVSPLLKSKWIMGVFYIIGGIIISYLCYEIAIFAPENILYRILIYFVCACLGLWGMIVSTAGVYIALMSFITQYIVHDHKNGKRYRVFSLFK